MVGKNKFLMEKEEKLLEFKNKLSDSLQDLLNTKALTLSDLSRAVDIPYEELDNFIKGIYFPSVGLSIRLANYFCCSLQYLFGLTGNTKDVKVIKASNFYNNFLKVAKENKKTVYRISKDLSLSRSITEKWKNGSLPRMSTVLLIADYLGVTIDELVCEK